MRKENYYNGLMAELVDASDFEEKNLHIFYMKRVNYTKELLEEKIQNCYSFAELCRRLGLKPEGSNPKTVRKKLDEFGVDYSHFTGKAWNKTLKIQYIEKSIYLICANIVL